MSASECILHVGMDKTGSTSIQASLHRNPSLRGAHWVDLGMANAARPLAFALADDPVQAPQAKREAMSAEAALALKQQALLRLAGQWAAPAERFLLSGEQLSFLRLAQVLRLRELVSRPGCDVSVVAYVRGARSYMESSLQQEAKKGMKQLDLHVRMPRYAQRFKPHVEVFGAAQVKLWPFEPQRFPAGCVVQDFCGRLGLEVAPNTIDRKKESLSRGAVSMLMLFWRSAGPQAGATVSSMSRRFVRMVSEAPGPKVRLSPEVLEPLFKKSRPEFDWIHERMEVRMDDLGEARADDVRNTADLLKLQPEAQEWLEEKLGCSFGKAPEPSELGKALRAWAKAAEKNKRAIRP